MAGLTNFAAMERESAMRHKPVTPEVAAEIVALYKAGWSQLRIARYTNTGQPRVRQIIVAAGVRIPPRGSKGSKCIDCRKPTNNAARCPYHAKIRNAEMNLRLVRKRNGIKPAKWRVNLDEGDPRGYYGPIAVEWKKKKSGRYGPMVMQAETGLI